MLLTVPRLAVFWALASNVGFGADPGRGVEGRVRAADGRPVRGAIVCLVSRDARVVDAASGPDGEFEFAEVPPGAYVLTAAAPGHAARKSTVVLVGAAGRARVDLRLDGRGVIVSGRIIERGPHGVAGAVVSMTDPGGVSSIDPPAVYRTKSDTEGRYSLELAPGHYGVLVEAAGRLGPAPASLHVVRERTKDFQIQPGARLTGTLVDETSGKPAGAGRVWLSCDEGGRAAPLEAASDESGRFTIEGAPGGNCRLVARAERGLVANEALVLRAGESREGARILLRAGRSLRGHVTSAAGAALASASVTLTPLAAGSGGPLRTTSAADGRYELFGVLPGEFRLSVESHVGDSTVRRLWIPPAGDVPDADVAAAAAIVVRGRAVDENGHPVPGTRISARYRPTGDSPSEGDVTFDDTDAEGRFELRSRGPGRLTLNARDASGRSGVAGPLVVPADDLDLTVTLAPSTTVAGTVRYADGTPAAGIRVETLFRGGAEAAWPGALAVTDSRGRYEVGPLDPGTHWVTAVRRGPAVFSTAPQPSRQIEVSVKPGDSRDGVDFVLPDAGRTIAGTVSGPDGKPLPNARVTAQDPRLGPGMMPVESCVSGPDGRFVLDDLDDAEFTVRVALEGYADHERKAVRGGTGELHLSLPAPAQLAGTVTLADGSPAEEFIVAALPVGDAESLAEAVARRSQAARRPRPTKDPGGRFVVTGLRGDHYEVRATTRDGRSGSTWVRIAAGETKDGLRIVIGQGVAVTGSVVGPDGRPIPRALVRSAGAHAAPIMTVADEDGRFTLDGVPPDPVLRLVASSPDPAGGTGRIAVPVRAETRAIDAGPIVLSPSGGRTGGALPTAPEGLPSRLPQRQSETGTPAGPTLD